MPETGLAYAHRQHGTTRGKNVGGGGSSEPQLVALFQKRQPLPVCGSSSWCSCNLRPALTYNTLVISQSSKSLSVNSYAQPSTKIRVL